VMEDSAESMEIKIAYLEKAVADLSGLVYEYGRRTERLEDAVRAMAKRISDMGSDKAPGMPAGERPPHY